MSKFQHGQDPHDEIAIIYLVLLCANSGDHTCFHIFGKHRKSEFLVGVILEGDVPVVVLLLKGGGEVVLSECRVDVVVLLDGDVKLVLLEGGE
jgi:hypothetical protein